MTALARGTAMFAKGALGVSSLLLVISLAPLLRTANVGAARTTAGATYVKGRVQSGTEVIAFFIGSSTCGAAEHPRLPGAIARLRVTLAAKAKAEGKRFVFAGVALDEKPAIGLKFLDKFGPFDEVLSGGSWFGTGAVDFMIRGIPGPLSTPQLLIIERDAKMAGSTITMGPDRTVLRALGFSEILELAGMPDSTGRQGR